MKTAINHGGISSVIALDGDNVVTGSVQDCTAILEDATARRNEGMTGSKELKHAARFPAVIVETYMNETGISFAEFMRNPVHCQRMLADPALKNFRIWEGRVA